MSPTIHAARQGARRGLIELRQSLAAGEVIGWIWPAIIAVVVLYVLRDRHVPGTSFSLGTGAIPGLVAANLIFSAMMGVAVYLVLDRQDGTLLRLRLLPHGMIAYLAGKITTGIGMSIITGLAILVPAALLFDGLELGPRAWLELLAVLLLGFCATLPLGAVIGSLLSSQGTLSVVSLLVTGLIAISGVFYPITALPAWLALLGQVFPVYWLGLGMRAALLPDALAAAEVGGSWRTLEMLGVLGAWTVAGLVLVPIVLRRIARRTAGRQLPAHMLAGARLGAAREEAAR